MKNEVCSSRRFHSLLEDEWSRLVRAMEAFLGILIGFYKMESVSELWQEQQK